MQYYLWLSLERCKNLKHPYACEEKLQFCVVFFFTLGSVVDMLHAASLTRKLLERGSDAVSAITTSLKQVYHRNQVSEQNKQVSSLSGILEEFVPRGKQLGLPKHLSTQH